VAIVCHKNYKNPSAQIAIETIISFEIFWRSLALNVAAIVANQQRRGKKSKKIGRKEEEEGKDFC